jgi:hypothetical protein
MLIPFLLEGTALVAVLQERGALRLAATTSIGIPELPLDAVSPLGIDMGMDPRPQRSRVSVAPVPARQHVRGAGTAQAVLTEPDLLGAAHPPGRPAHRCRDEPVIGCLAPIDGIYPPG